MVELTCSYHMSYRHIATNITIIVLSALGKVGIQFAARNEFKKTPAA